MEIYLVHYLLLVIAVWRVTHLISSEDGPFDIIIRVRKWVGNSFFGKLMDCFYCLSVWIGFCAAIYVTRDPEMLIVLTLYYSGSAILLEKITNKTFQ